MIGRISKYQYLLLLSLMLSIIPGTIVTGETNGFSFNSTDYSSPGTGYSPTPEMTAIPTSEPTMFAPTTIVTEQTIQPPTDTETPGEPAPIIIETTLPTIIPTLTDEPDDSNNPAVNESIFSMKKTEGGVSVQGTLDYTWSDPPLNTSSDNPYYYNSGGGWVINESGHDWVMDLDPSHNTGTGFNNVTFDSSTKTFSNFGTEFAIFINSSDVMFDGMGAILDGGRKTRYGILVNNQSTGSYETFSSDSASALSGINIKNITLFNFLNTGIFFNNVISTLSNPGINPSNIINVNSSYNTGNGIVIQNSNGIEVSSNTLNNIVGIISAGDNNTFSAVNSSYNSYAGIYSLGNNNTFSNVNSSNNYYLAGIYSKGNNNTFSDINSRNDSYGILSVGDKNTIYNVNSSYNIIYGIVSQGDNNTIYNVNSRNDSYGIVSQGDNNTIYNVNSRNDRFGIVSQGDNNTIYNVNSSYNIIYGIVSQGDNNTFSTLTSNYNSIDGIYSEGDNNTFSAITGSYNIGNGTEIKGNWNTLSNSNFQNNGQHGLVIDLSSNNNKISHNLFKNNGNSPSDNVNVSDSDTNIWDDTTGGNFYGYYGQGFSETCNNTDQNDICDDPFTINANNIDYKPLTTQNITPTPTATTKPTINPTPTTQVTSSVPINPYYTGQSSGSYESGSSDESSNTKPYSGLLTGSNIPNTAQTGQSTQISFTFTNNGEFDWNAYNQVGVLVQLKDNNGNVVATLIIPVPEGVTIARGQSYTFTGSLQMPSTAGTYSMTAQLEHTMGNTPMTFGEPFQQAITVGSSGKTMNSFHRPTPLITILLPTPTTVSHYYPTQYPRPTPY